VLQLLLIHVPLLIALVAGDMIAGEANMGTLRILMTKPFTRTEFILSKFIAATIYTLLLLTFMAVLALVLSIVIFGTGDLMLLKGEGVVLLDSSDILWRYFAAFGFAAIAMMTVAAMAFLFSVFADNSIGPIITTMCVIIIFTILTTLDIPIFNTFKPYIFTNHMLRWKDFFDMEVNEMNDGVIGSVQNLKGIINSAVLLLAHTVFFVSLAVISFRKKDILS
jgi:ABC-2 type transport system permease protein